MLIYTLDHTLHVLQIIRQTSTVVTYICTDMTENEPHTYILNGFLKTESYHYLIPLILEQNNSHFTDFIESFSADGIFYMLFKYQNGVPLIKQCEHADMEQRLEYIRRMIEQMVLQDMPVVFQYAVLISEQILLTVEKHVQFRYDLPDDFGQDSVTFHDVELRLLELLKQILSHELEMMYSDNLMDFCKKLLNGGSYKDYTSIYAEFCEVKNELTNKSNNFVSKKYRFQLWESIKKYGNKIWQFIIVLIIIISAAAMLYEMFEKSEENESEAPIRQIGTLIIKENQSVNTTMVVLTENE